MKLLVEKVNDIACVDQPMRAGNKAFRTWLAYLTGSSHKYLAELSDAPEYQKAIPEIRHYLNRSFGSYGSVCFGTGHELNFIVFLFCLFKIGVLTRQDLKPVIT